MENIDLGKWVVKFLPADGETSFRTLDGSDVAEWLQKNGETVVLHYDTGRNGLAITASGYRVSSNGYVSKYSGDRDAGGSGDDATSKGGRDR